METGEKLFAAAVFIVVLLLVLAALDSHEHQTELRKKIAAQCQMRPALSGREGK